MDKDKSNMDKKTKHLLQSICWDLTVGSGEQRELSEQLQSYIERSFKRPLTCEEWKYVSKEIRACNDAMSNP